MRGMLMWSAVLGITVAAESPGRMLRAAIVLEMSPAQVWDLWTTEQGLVSFFAPAARLEPRVDGAYEIFFDPAAPVGRRGADGMRILAYEPLQRLSFTWNAPIDQAYVRAQRTVVTVELRPVSDARTHLTFTHAGWGTGPEWDRAYAYFDTAWNAVVLPRLRYRVTHGPVDWSRPPVLQPIAPTLKVSRGAPY